MNTILVSYIGYNLDLIKYLITLVLRINVGKYLFQEQLTRYLIKNKIRK